MKKLNYVIISTVLCWSSFALATTEPVSIEGSWMGIGQFTDRGSSAPFPLVCMKMIANASKLNKTCQKYSETGQLLQLHFSCADPLLSETGQALFTQDVKICERIKDLSDVPGANGRKVFSTNLSVEDPLEESGMTNSTSFISQRDSSAYSQPPVPGTKQIIEFKYSRNFEELAHRFISIEAHFYRPAYQ